MRCDLVKIDEAWCRLLTCKL